jgi:hypothetical protein
MTGGAESHGKEAAISEMAAAPLNNLWRALPWLIVAAIALAPILLVYASGDYRAAHAGDSAASCQSA